MAKKADVLKQWRELPENLPILPHMRPVPYKAEGSRYGSCGIRIDGNPQFVSAVLSRLKDLLAGENTVTRLGLSRAPAVTGFKPSPNALPDAECCYIRLCERGGQSSHAMAIFATAEEQSATRDYAAALGVAIE